MKIKFLSIGVIIGLALGLSLSGVIFDAGKEVSVKAENENAKGNEIKKHDMLKLVVCTDCQLDEKTVMEIRKSISDVTNHLKIVESNNLESLIKVIGKIPVRKRSLKKKTEVEVKLYKSLLEEITNVGWILQSEDLISLCTARSNNFAKNSESPLSKECYRKIREIRSSFERISEMTSESGD
jgi:hypothetical protein